MVVGFIATYAILAYKKLSLNPAHREVYSIQHYLIKFVNDLKVGGFLLVLRFPPLIKRTATI
jgi:hypothetical protein